MKMRRKIKNIKQLGKERRKLQQRERELMYQINSNWGNLKEQLSPSNLFGDQFWKCREYRQRKDNDNILKSVFSFAANMMIRKFMKKTEEFFS